MKIEKQVNFSQQHSLRVSINGFCLTIVLRSLRKEGYSQNEIDYLFQALVMPNITYGLSVYGASNAELRSVQQFLDRCKKRGYTSKPIDVKLLLNEQDKRISNKVRKLENHPLYEFLPKIRNTGYNLIIENNCN